MEQGFCVNCMSSLRPGGRICSRCGFDNAKSTQPEFALPRGTRLHGGKYLIGKVLGQGGFGITYIGLDEALEMKVAVKEYYPMGLVSRMANGASLVWHSSVQDRQAGRESFVKEARKMAKIHHIPNVVGVREVFFENETAYIVMDYIEGETLKARLERTGPMTEAECLQLLEPIMDAMGEAHEEGLIHRDISPDNIMLDARGRIWLMDLGAAKEMDSASASVTQSSQMVVKHGFSPPEQSASKGKIGPWTDVYAMCATLYWCVTGRILPDSIDRMMGTEVVHFPDTLLPAWKAAIEHGLALRPEERVQCMDELLAALGTSAAEQVPPEQPAPKTEPVPKAEQTLKTEPVLKAEQTPKTEPVPKPTQPPKAAPAPRPEPMRKALPKWLVPAASAAAVLALCAGALSMNGGKADLGVRATESEKAEDAVTTAAVLLEEDQTKETEQAEKASDDSEKVDAVKETAEEAAAKKTEEEATAKKAEEEAASKKKAEEEVAAKKKAEEEAASAALSGTCGPNAKWTLTDGTLRIYGSGAMEDYRSGDRPWDEQSEAVLKVVIESGITSIGDGAFRNIHELTSISIPSSVTKISDGAFNGCNSLVSAIIPDGVTSISEFTFANCSSLMSVTIPKSVESIGRGAFSGCSSLPNITIPYGVKQVGSRAFNGCASLKNMTIPDSVKEIGDGAFEGCSGLLSVNFLGTVSSISYYTFSGCSALTSITIPSGVKEISTWAFQNCTSLEDVEFPDSVTEINWDAFKNCTKLSSVTVGQNTSIDEEAFPETTMVNRR